MQATTNCTNRDENKSTYKKKMKKLLDKLVRALATKIEAETGTSAACVWTAIDLAMLKAEIQPSYREIVTHLESKEGERRRRCDLDYVPSKSTLHGMITMIQHPGKEFMDAVVLGMSA